MQTVLQDLRFGVRRLRKSPGFAFFAILTLGLGIGSVTSVFSVVNSVLLKPFAFHDPERLVVMREAARERNEPPGPDNYQHYLNWQANTKALTDVAIFGNRSYSVSTDTDHPNIVQGLEISPNLFSVLGVQPVLGRTFLPAETLEGHNQEVILSWSAWQKYFHGDPGAIGRTLRLGGIPQTVIGIMTEGFSFPHMSEMSTAVVQRAVRPYEIFKPLLPDTSTSGNYNYLVIGRLQAGVSRAQAQGELSGLQQAYARTLAPGTADTRVVVEPLAQEVAGRVSTALWLFVAAAPANLPRLNEVHVNWLALLAAAGLSIMTALLFGLLPALRAIHVDPQRAMQSNPTRIA